MPQSETKIKFQQRDDKKINYLNTLPTEILQTIVIEHTPDPHTAAHVISQLSREMNERMNDRHNLNEIWARRLKREFNVVLPANQSSQTALQLYDKQLDNIILKNDSGKPIQKISHKNSAAFIKSLGSRIHSEHFVKKLIKKIYLTGALLPNQIYSNKSIHYLINNLILPQHHPDQDRCYLKASLAKSIFNQWLQITHPESESYTDYTATQTNSFASAFFKKFITPRKNRENNRALLKYCLTIINGHRFEGVYLAEIGNILVKHDVNNMTYAMECLNANKAAVYFFNFSDDTREYITTTIEDKFIQLLENVHNSSSTLWSKKEAGYESRSIRPCPEKKELINHLLDKITTKAPHELKSITKWLQKASSKRIGLGKYIVLITLEHNTNMTNLSIRSDFYSKIAKKNPLNFIYLQLPGIKNDINIIFIDEFLNQYGCLSSEHYSSEEDKDTFRNVIFNFAIDRDVFQICSGVRTIPINIATDLTLWQKIQASNSSFKPLFTSFTPVVEVLKRPRNEITAQNPPQAKRAKMAISYNRARFWYETLSPFTQDVNWDTYEEKDNNYRV